MEKIDEPTHLRYSQQYKSICEIQSAILTLSCWRCRRLERDVPFLTKAHNQKNFKVLVLGLWPELSESGSPATH